MKDLSLSLLSRGCGRYVSSSGNVGRNDGRLDVCFTPQDYHIWRSRDSLLQLSNSGHLLLETQSTLPKTYSTRRGPLLLYSQYLFTMETSCPSETRDRKKPVVQRYTQHVEQQLRSLKRLKAAILSSSHSQSTSSRLGPPSFPPLHLPLPPDLHRPSAASSKSTREQSSPELPAQLNPQFFPAEKITEPLESQAEDKEEKQRDRKRVRLDLFLHIPHTSNSPTPQMEPQPGVQNDPEEAQIDLDVDLQHTETNLHSMACEPHHPNMICDLTDDQSCSTEGSEPTSNKGNYDSLTHTDRHRRTGLLPPLMVGPSWNCHGTCREKVDRPRWEGPSTDERHLPSIAESHTVVPGWAQTQKDALPKAERVRVQTQQSLPLLCPVKRELPPPVGVLGYIMGRKGPGKQSSLAFLQNRLVDPQDIWDTSDANRGVVRGLLPLELRDLQDSRTAGSLLLGPDGEIIQLSLFENGQGQPQGDSDIQEQALQVLTTEGEKLPWIIVLQPEDTDSEGMVEPKTDAPECDIMHHQPKHELLDLHRQKKSSRPSSHTDALNEDPVAVSKKKAKSTETAAKTQKLPKMTAKNNVVMPPMRQWGGVEAPRGNTTAEEENKEEGPGSTTQTNHVSGSRQPGERQQFKRDVSSSKHDVNQNEGTEQTRNNTKKNAKRKDAEEASGTEGNKDAKTVRSAGSDGQKISSRSQDGQRLRQKAGSDSQHIRSQKQERGPNREAVETREQSPVKKMTDSELKMNEEEGEQGEQMRLREESTKRRRRGGRPHHKDSVVGSNKDIEVKQAEEEESLLISTQKGSAAQSLDNQTNLEEEMEQLKAASSIQSASSLGSTALSPFNHRRLRMSTASSCEAAVPVSAMELTSSCGRLSSCSTVMIMEEQLMLKPVKPESSRPRNSQKKMEQEAAALHLARQAERRRQEVERKRREREEEERRQQEREQTEDRMRSELEEDRRKRAEELRLKRLAEEEERKKREEEEQGRAKREQERREREKRRQEERRRQMERLQKMREEEEQRRRAEEERLCQEEERRQEEELKKLEGMDESERTEYLQKKEQEAEDRRNKEEERKRKEEEAALRATEEARLQAQLLARQMALLRQQLDFKRGLLLEAGGLEKAQGISRPWIYSYFTLLQMLGLNQTKAESMTP